MANWKYKMDISDLIEQYHNDEFSVNELGIKVAERIREQVYFEKNKVPLRCIANKFTKVKTEKGFNGVMGTLYDWGDDIWAPSDSVIQNRNCWIGT